MRADVTEKPQANLPHQPGNDEFIGRQENIGPKVKILQRQFHEGLSCKICNRLRLSSLLKLCSLYADTYGIVEQSLGRVRPDIGIRRIAA